MKKIELITEKIGAVIFRYRYVIAAIIFILCVVFEISRSSIGIIYELFGVEDTGLLFGHSRVVRSDEWSVDNGMLWSQYLNRHGAFSYFNPQARAADTDMFLVSAQPVKTPMMIFRIFQVGYLFLPIAKGMSFYWCGLLIALFMVSFELGRLITGDRKLLALLYSMMVTFSPGAQWWGVIVDLLIFMQLSIVVFYYYLRESSVIRRGVQAFVIMICAGSYILNMYPAWMVPFAYVLLGLIIWIFFTTQNKKRLKWQDGIVITLMVVLLVASMLYIYHMSADTIRIYLNTAYPGGRKSGTDAIGETSFFWYIFNMWLPLKGAPVINESEVSQMMDFFPIGMILACMVMISRIRRGQKQDPLMVLMMVLSAFFGSWCAFGYPDMVARITLLSYSPPIRTTITFGFINIILLIRSLIYIGEINIKAWAAVAISMLICGIGVFMVVMLNPGYYSITMIAVMAATILAIDVGLFLSRNRTISILTSVVIMIFMLIVGGTVNPIRTGVDDMYNIDFLNTVRQMVSNDPDSVWITDSSVAGFDCSNVLLTTGASVVNCTNMYPYLDRWHILDPEREYEEIYNRYATIHAYIVDDREGIDQFHIDEGANARFDVYLTREDLDLIGVTHVVSRDSELLGEQPVGNGNGLYIYDFSSCK